MDSATLPRHGRGVRMLHGINALVVLILLVTGLALGGLLPGRAVALLGGHLGTDAAHRLLGLAFAVALVVLVATLPRRAGRLLRDVVRFRHGDWRWPLRFLAFYGARRGGRAPFHDGRFDPAQRIVFMGLVLAVAAVAASGVYLYFWTPAFPLGQASLAFAIRVHVAAAWLLIACLCLHVIAGSGLPWTHRGLVAAMFGNGRVPAVLAHTLWPGWASRMVADTRQRPSIDRDHRDA
ncbi:MAG: cytochrome b/b6 domain-containing protein [Rhodanobacteraceae bacterium]|nr:MAG: cytochrome b/b6 domain-containing protein [Rhodanobacteraceae bacterium]